MKGKTDTMKQERTSSYRRLSMLGFEMVQGGHNFYALLEFDVTDLRKALRGHRKQGGRASFFAFMLKAIGTVLQEYPEFNAMINPRRKTTFEEVDLDIPIEVVGEDRIYNKQCLIRDVGTKDVGQIDGEIRRAKAETGEGETYMASRLGQRIFSSLPSPLVLFLFRRILKNHRLVKKYSGTAFVTSVSMFSKAPGFILPYAGGPKAVSFAIGSVVKKPVVRGEEVVIREILSLTAAFNHDLVDGAPAARLINRLRRLIEKESRELLQVSG